MSVNIQACQTCFAVVFPWLGVVPWMMMDDHPPASALEKASMPSSMKRLVLVSAHRMCFTFQNCLMKSCRRPSANHGASAVLGDLGRCGLWAVDPGPAGFLRISLLCALSTLGLAILCSVDRALTKG